ncbi:MAG: ATP-binding protein [Tepidisphaeraceae bacterium]
MTLKGPIVVGLSGGKDSFCLCLALRALGYDVRAAIVDLGYKRFQAHKVRDTAVALGISADVLLPAEARTANNPRLKRHLAVLQSSAQMPCGPCSSAKRILLQQHVERMGGSYLALAHHRDDLIVTLLKDYFIADYYERFGAYDASDFFDYLQSATVDEEKLKQLIDTGSASTMGVTLPLDSCCTLVRPMAYIAEDEIRSFIASARVEIMGSGCSHDSLNSPTSVRTKRELVHDRWLSLLAHDPAKGDRLLQIALTSLDSSGRQKSNPRAARRSRMPGFDDETPCNSEQ